MIASAPKGARGAVRAWLMVIFALVAVINPIGTAVWIAFASGERVVD